MTASDPTCAICGTVGPVALLATVGRAQRATLCTACSADPTTVRAFVAQFTGARRDDDPVRAANRFLADLAAAPTRGRDVAQ
jgi:hypothetical protein